MPARILPNKLSETKTSNGYTNLADQVASTKSLCDWKVELTRKLYSLYSASQLLPDKSQRRYLFNESSLEYMILERKASKYSKDNVPEIRWFGCSRIGDCEAIFVKFEPESRSDDARVLSPAIVFITSIWFLPVVFSRCLFLPGWLKVERAAYVVGCRIKSGPREERNTSTEGWGLF